MLEKIAWLLVILRDASRHCSKLVLCGKTACRLGKLRGIWWILCKCVLFGRAVWLPGKLRIGRPCLAKPVLPGEVSRRCDVLMGAMRLLGKLGSLGRLVFD